jgi:LysR family transcriptional regulator, cell division regulator
MRGGLAEACYAYKRLVMILLISEGDGMDAGALRVFETVARTGGMNRAAAALNTVQSNVTARIQALEAELACPLFERHSRGVVLTAAGERLLPYAQRLAQLLADAARAARDTGAPQGPLTIGSLETNAALWLASLLSDYVVTYPGVDLALRPGTTAELIEAVVGHRLEGAFVCGPVAHPSLVEERMFTEDLALLAAPGVPSLEVALGDGAVRIVVLRAGCSYRQRLEALLARRGIAIPRLLEFGTLEAIFGCVAAGLGITLLPRGLVGPVWQAGRVSVHRLPASEARVSTVFVRRREAFVSSALRAFLDRARAAFAAPLVDGSWEQRLPVSGRFGRGRVGAGAKGADHEDGVEPTSMFPTDIGQDAGVGEAAARVQADAGEGGGVTDHGDDEAQVERLTALQQRR